jgi:hypothetical protein
MIKNPSAGIDDYVSVTRERKGEVQMDVTT